MLINSQVSVNKNDFFCTNWTKEEISNEPMFYRASFDFVLEHGGPITKNFIYSMPTDWYREKDLTIDTRVHMLMPGWYPCIPGWHHDDIPRTRIDGQPNYEEMEYSAEHLMGLVNADIAPTEFATGVIQLDIPPVGKTIYKQWHLEVDHALNSGKLNSVKVKSGYYYEFDNFSFHQGTPAVKSGWRWFARVSRNTARAKDCKNEIRKQVQVYMKNPMEGW